MLFMNYFSVHLISYSVGLFLSKENKCQIYTCESNFCFCTHHFVLKTPYSSHVRFVQHDNLIGVQGVVGDKSIISNLNVFFLEEVGKKYQLKWTVKGMSLSDTLRNEKLQIWDATFTPP